jgi:hypothetical protein
LSDDAPPAWMLERHPEIVAIREAHAQHQRGEPITARCMHCDKTLTITRVLDAITTSCPCGKTAERLRLAKSDERPG